MTAKGSFEVDSSPLEFSTGGNEGITLGRMSLKKTFIGDLDASSAGEMLTAMTPTDGSAGYVAIEQVTGILGERTGSFVLQHFGTMQAGDERLILEVVPDSGTGELSGLSGRMSISVEGGEHKYEFEYALE